MALGIPTAAMASPAEISDVSHAARYPLRLGRSRNHAAIPPEFRRSGEVGGGMCTMRRHLARGPLLRGHKTKILPELALSTDIFVGTDESFLPVFYRPSPHSPTIPPSGPTGTEFASQALRLCRITSARSVIPVEAAFHVIPCPETPAAVLAVKPRRGPPPAKHCGLVLRNASLGSDIGEFAVNMSLQSHKVEKRHGSCW